MLRKAHNDELNESCKNWSTKIGVGQTKTCANGSTTREHNDDWGAHSLGNISFQNWDLRVSKQCFEFASSNLTWRKPKYIKQAQQAHVVGLVLSLRHQVEYRLVWKRIELNLNELPRPSVECFFGLSSKLKAFKVFQYASPRHSRQ